MDIVFVRDIVGGVLCSPKFCSTGTGGREAYEREYYNEKIVLDTADIAFRLAEGEQVLGTWAGFDLSPLGEVSRVVFSIESNDVGEYGLNVPAFFCIDNIEMQ